MSKSFAIGAIIGASVGASVGKAFDTLDNRARKARDHLKKVRIGEKAAKDVIKYKNTLEQLKAKQQQVGTSSTRLNRGIADVEKRYRKAKSEAKRYGLSIKNIARDHDRLAREARKASRELDKVAKRRRIGKAFNESKAQLAGLAGGTYVAGRTIGGAQDFGRSGTRLSTVINTDKDNVGEALALSRSHALSFARRSLADEKDILNIEYSLNSAGLDAEASRLGSEVVSKVSTVTNGAAEQVGEVIATTFNNLGDSLEGSTEDRLNRIGDLLTKTQFKFQIRDFGQLGESLKLGSPILAQYNVKLEQGLTLLGMLNSAGLQGSMAGTALSATMRQLSKASEEFNFQLVRNADGSFDFIKTMENLSDAIGGFDDLDQDTIDRLQTVFGDEGIRGVVLMGKKLKELSAAQDDVAKSSKNIVDKSYEAFLKDSQGQYDLAVKNIRLIGLSIANTMLPAVNAVLTPVAEFSAWVGNAIDQFPVLGQTIGFAVVGFGLYKTAAIGAALWTGNFGKALDLLTLRKIPKAIFGLGKLAKAKTLAAVAGAGGAKGLLGLAGKAGAVGLAGAAGYGVGSLIYKGIEGTTAADKIGAGVANLLAFFGNDEAKAALEAREKTENKQVNQTTHITVHGRNGQNAREIAEEIAKLQEQGIRGALHDGATA